MKILGAYGYSTEFPVERYYRDAKSYQIVEGSSNVQKMIIAQAALECTLPRHLDPVAARFPNVPIIMAHLGHPYEGECVVTARKHPHVYADISALHYRPFQLYHSLMLVQEYGVWDKVLFATDYPFTNVDATLAGLRSLNRMLAGTALPRLDEVLIERMIYRDTLNLLGIEP